MEEKRGKFGKMNRNEIAINKPLLREANQMLKQTVRTGTADTGSVHANV